MPGMLVLIYKQLSVGFAGSKWLSVIEAYDNDKFTQYSLTVCIEYENHIDIYIINSYL